MTRRVNDPHFLIIGGGRFGRRAVHHLAEKHPPDRITVVDPDPASLAEIAVQSAKKIQSDGTRFLIEALGLPHPPEWVIPCVPFHLAWAGLLGRLAGQARPIPVPREFTDGLPHPLAAADGGWFLSHADFLCPPDCPEPADICTHTGLPRGRSLFEAIGSQRVEGYSVLVLRSRQLAPGLGGFLAAELLAIEEAIRTRPGRFIVATACRCHGVAHGIEWGKEGF